MCSLNDCYWISQSLQQLKSDDLGDSSRQTRLQRRRQFCKLISTKKRRDLKVKARADIGNKTVSTNFTGVLLLYYAAALLCRKCTNNVFFLMSPPVISLNQSPCIQHKYPNKYYTIQRISHLIKNFILFEPEHPQKHDTFT